MKKIMERIKEESFLFYKGGILINHDFLIILLGLPYTFNIINYKSIWFFYFRRLILAVNNLTKLDVDTFIAIVASRIFQHILINKNSYLLYKV